MADIEQADNIVKGKGIVVRFCAACAVGQVFADGQVREQAGFLKDIADRPLMGPVEQAGSVILPSLRSDFQMSWVDS